MTTPDTREKIVIAGGTGQLGTLLARHYHERGFDVVVLGRTPPATELPWTFATWDAVTLGPWTEHIDGAHCVINLAGRSVDCRYTPENRAQMMSSRVDSTKVVGEAIAQAEHPPAVWLQASTATIYSHRFDAANDEATGKINEDAEGASESWNFSVEIAKAWEATLEQADTPHTRKVAMRTSMVMSPDPGGVFDVMRGMVATGLGGQQGHGRQYISWIHGEDFVRAVEFLRVHDEAEGAINVTSPNPEPNADFMRSLRKAWGAKVGLPAMAWMVEIGAVFMRTESELVLKSRRVVPGRLTEWGFDFEHPTWPEAAQDLCTEWKRRAASR